MAANIKTETPPRNNDDDLYWQVEKCASDSYLHLYKRQLWTDVSIRCKDHVTEHPEDRLRAHKLILTARSPVFRAMFYGPTSGDTQEVHIPEHSKESVDTFLRCLYNDDEMALELEDAMDVLMIGHFYQVKLGNWLGEIIRKYTPIDINNACHMLEQSVMYGQTSLRDFVLEFIDDNTEEVLKTDGFLTISKDTLEYMLKGDTLFADEENIVTAATSWATAKLKECNEDVDGKSIRKVLGRAFYFLRMGTLSAKSFSEIEESYRFYTYEECFEIFSHISGRKSRESSCHFPSNKRVPREMSINYSKESSFPSLSNSKPQAVVNISTCNDVTVTQLIIELPTCTIKGNGDNAEFQCTHVYFNVEISCTTLGCNQNKSISGSGGSRHTLTLEPPLTIPSRSSPTMVTVVLNGPSFLQRRKLSTTRFDGIDYQDTAIEISYGRQRFSTASSFSNKACKNTSIQIEQNAILAGITVVYQSKREANRKRESVDDVENTEGNNKRLKLDADVHD